MKLTFKRAASLWIVAVIYLFAAAGGIALYLALPFALWLRLLLADVAATVFVFLFSLLFQNASVYDPYWSVQPPVILLALAVTRPVSSANLLLVTAALLWGLRLTWNWARGFRGLAHQDWRYTMLRRTAGKAYPLVNFFGIHLFPTLIVYACVLPAAMAVSLGRGADLLTWTGFFICFGATLLQAAADRQMHRFRSEGTGGLIRTGLWTHSRHPNYLGEILMWWGMALAAASVLGLHWYGFLGAVCCHLMFLFISIPMAEKRQSAKPGWARYCAGTRMLLPIPKHTEDESWINEAKPENK